MGGRSLPPQFWSSPHLHGGTGGNQLADAHRTAPPPSPRTRRTHPARHPPSAPHAHHLTHALAAILSVILGAIPTPALTRTRRRRTWGRARSSEILPSESLLGISTLRRAPVRRRAPFLRTRPHGRHHRAMKTHNLVIFRRRYSGLGRSHLSVEMQFNRACYPYPYSRPAPPSPTHTAPPRTPPPRTPQHPPAHTPHTHRTHARTPFRVEMEWR